MVIIDVSSSWYPIASGEPQAGLKITTSDGNDCCALADGCGAALKINLYLQPKLQLYLVCMAVCALLK